MHGTPKRQADEAERLRRRAAERPAEAEAAFARAAKIRTALAHTFLAAQRQEPVAQTHLDAFNHALAESSLTLRLVAAESGAAWTWVGGEDALDTLLSPILRSADEVLTAGRERSHVRQCAGQGCRLFFVDRTPSRRRRWCAMEDCGNRVKTRSYYRRVGRPSGSRCERTHFPSRAFARQQKPTQKGELSNRIAPNPVKTRGFTQE